MPTPDPYDPAANATFRDAFDAYWRSTPALVAISVWPYGDVAPQGVPEGGPYVVLEEVTSRAGGHATTTLGEPAWEETTYRLSLFHRDKAEAIRLGHLMRDLLKPIGGRKLQFTDGYQMAWIRESPRLMKVPEYGAARTIWRHSFVYRVVVGRD